MAYHPSFTRNPMGKFNPNLGFVSIKGGSDAYLLEDELNELQWIQNEARANLIRQITKSGCLQKNSFVDSYIQGGLQALGKQQLNGFLLYDFEAVINGYITYINSSDSTGNLIILSAPPKTGTRADFVYLEFWFQELKENDIIPKFGGINNEAVEYDIVDKRYGFQTSRRIQLQWAIRTFEGLDYSTYTNGFVDSNSNSNMNIQPLAANQNYVNNYYFKSFAKDENLYISGNGETIDKTALNTVDGYVYAIPLLIVNRLNSGGYHEINNPNGGVNYVDKNTVPGRPDGKYANIIYNDQVIDLRKLAYISAKQYDSVYCKIDDLNAYKDYVNTNVLQPLTKAQNDIYLLDDLLKNDIIKNQIPAKADITYVDSKFATLNTNLSAQINLVNIKADNTQSQLETNITRLDASVNDLTNLINTKIDASIVTLTQSIDELNNELRDNVNTINTRIDGLEDDLRSEIAVLNTSVNNAIYSFSGAVNSISELMGQVTNLTERVANLENQLLDLGFDPVKTDTVVYGIEMQRNSILSPGGIMNYDTKKINSNGVAISTIYFDVNDYSVIYTINNVPDGKIGEIWIEKADTSYLFKNSGYGSIKVESVVFKNDGVRSFKGQATYNGINGTKITRAIQSTDFIYVISLNDTYGDIGEVYIDRLSDGFRVSNTGAAGYNFEWFVIDTTQLRNIELMNVSLNSVNGKIATGAYGNNFSVLVGLPPKPATHIGGIGEITISKSFNSFTVYNSGTNIGDNVQCLIFKEKEITN